MRHKLISVMLLFLPLLEGCASPPYVQSEPAPWDGTWQLAGYECDGGKLSRTGEEMAKAGIEEGVATLTTIQGTDVVTRQVSYDKSGKTLMRCETTLRERWNFDGSSKLLISDTVGFSVNFGPVAFSHCPKEVENKASRTHDYLLKRNLLKVTLSNHGYVSSGEGAPYCSSGKTVIIYRRIL
jgi:hypothetical protein